MIIMSMGGSMDWLTWVEKFGSTITFGLIIASMFFFLLKWVLEQSKVMLNQMANERASWLSTLKVINDQMLTIQQNNKLYYEQNNEAHKYQRDEHKEMIIVLGRINGYK